jgi:hypothetical protein
VLDIYIFDFPIPTGPNLFKVGTNSPAVKGNPNYANEGQPTSLW